MLYDVSIVEYSNYINLKYILKIALLNWFDVNEWR